MNDVSGASSFDRGEIGSSKSSQADFITRISCSDHVTAIFAPSLHIFAKTRFSRFMGLTFAVVLVPVALEHRKAMEDQVPSEETIQLRGSQAHHMFRVSAVTIKKYFPPSSTYP
mmetsp:Transcript_28877/g.48064  ORF Transcript_28877/g.48064 Transcript_28877/m.48064 type:complete len:114 (-) Transcript_28877:370-711(-)